MEPTSQYSTITFRITNVGKATLEFKVGPMQDVFDDLQSAPEIRPRGRDTWWMEQAGCPYAAAGLGAKDCGSSSNAAMQPVGLSIAHGPLPADDLDF